MSFYRFGVAHQCLIVVAGVAGMELVDLLEWVIRTNLEVKPIFSEYNGIHVVPHD